MPRVRPYEARDWDSFIALDLETGLASVESEEEDAFRERWPELLRTRFGWGDQGPTAQGSALLVLEADDGAYAGHLWVSEQVDLFTAATKLWITTMAVDAKYRGRGWGRLLMARALYEGRQRGLTRIGLSVDAANKTASRLYEEMGFATTRLTMELALED